MDLYANSLIEAEDFTVDQGFITKSGEFASNGKYVQSTSNQIASMHTEIEGRNGTYDLAVNYYDESDGQSWSRVLIDGQLADSWTWNNQNGSANAGTGSYSTRIIRDVTLDDLSRITIEGKGDDGEPLRIDNIQLMRSETLIDQDSNAAFDGSEGFGAVTKGGRGGIIIKVTNLNDSGEGSLRWALEELDFPRIVVFEVGGLIELSDQIEVNGDLTIAGQTAPGGITITGGRLRIVESDVIVQGLRIRPGDGDGQEGSQRDGITIGASEGIVERVVLDSNSFTWAVDENISIWSGARDITISNNIIAEGLRDSIHPEGEHSMGLLIGDGAERITITDNLFASNFHRNPHIADGTKVEFVNNVVSNWGNNGFQATIRDGSPMLAHVIGNVFVAGDDTSSIAPIRLQGWESGTEFVIRDNIAPGRETDGSEGSLIQSSTSKGISYSGTAFQSSDVTIQSSDRVLDYVLENVGARTAGEVDAIDQRIIGEVRTGEGKVIDSPLEDLSEVVQNSKTKDLLLDSDKDGMPDAHERILGSDPNTHDPHGDANGNGWLNIEEYFDVLLNDPTRLGQSGSTAGHDFVLQAENMTLENGFKIVANGFADGNAVIQAGSFDEEQVASFLFDGEEGIYEIALHHFDESDGASQLSVLLNDVVLTEWLWDEGVDSRTANGDSAMSRRIGNVDLQAGDEIKLVGFADDAEPLRIDFVEFDALFL